MECFNTMAWIILNYKFNMPSFEIIIVYFFFIEKEF